MPRRPSSARLSTTTWAGGASIVQRRLATWAVTSRWLTCPVLETPDELAALQTLLDESMASAGPHLREIIDDDRRLSALEVVEELQGMKLLVLATVSAEGRPLVGPVDGYFLHGSFYFSSGTRSVRMGHLSRRPWVSASHLPGEHLAITVHGRAATFSLSDPEHGELRRAMLEHYLPIAGSSFEEWLDDTDALGARIEADKMFTFALNR